jgi:uncharacterized iron-regulated membrane protein
MSASAWAEYERRKQAWLAANPNASADRRERALRRIACALGL